MRKTGALVWLGALATGLVLVTGLAGVNRARAAEGQTAWLGVYTQELTPELREGMDYQGSGGVLVSRLVKDGPADRAGVRRGDVILSVNSRSVDSPAELSDVIRAARVGQNIALEVFRDGQRRTLAVELGARPSDEEMEAPESPEPPDLGRALPERDFLREFNLPEGAVMRILGGPARGRLGVRIESLSPELGDYFGLKDGKGVLVLEVVKDTPAARAGLKAGDVITRVDDRAVNVAEDLVSALRGKEGKVALRVVRHGTPRTIEATLERPAPMRGGMQGGMGEGPGVRREIRVRLPDREQMQREIDQLKRRLDELQRRLDQEKGGRD